MIGILWLGLGLAAAQNGFVIKGDQVHTVSGPVIDNGVVVVVDGRIQSVGSVQDIQWPEDWPVYHGAVVVPGLIDAMGTAGLTGANNQGFDQDHRDGESDLQPALRALDAYNPHDSLVEWVRGYGVTTLHVGPSPGSPVGGRTLLTHTLGGSVDEVAIIEDGFVVFSLGEPAKRSRSRSGPRSRMGSAAIVRQMLYEAKQYQSRQRLPLADRPPLDLGLQALVELLEGKRRAVFHAHRADDLLTALRIADEFGLNIVLAGATEGYLIRDRIAQANVPVIVGPIMAHSRFAGERRNATFENAALLSEVGVPLAFMSGYQGYVPKVRVVLWEAAIAAANGLGPHTTLEALTLGAARILGVDDTLGSLDPGKVADVVIYDGDPFQYTSHACLVVIAGVVVSDTCR